MTFSIIHSSLLIRSFKQCRINSWWFRASATYPMFKSAFWPIGHSFFVWFVSRLRKDDGWRREEGFRYWCARIDLLEISLIWIELQFALLNNQCTSGRKNRRDWLILFTHRLASASPLVHSVQFEVRWNEINSISWINNRTRLSQQHIHHKMQTWFFFKKIRISPK